MVRIQFATAAAVVLLASSSASANFIDFRSSAFSASDNQGSFTYTTSDGTTVNISANGAKLYHDSTDGFGIRGSGYEADEIEGNESLTVTFSKSVYINSFLATDLFNESGYLEIGYYSLTGKTTEKFLADPSQITGTNGEKTVGINQYANSITFTAPGKVWSGFTLQNHEFSVGGITIGNGASIPELDPGPAASALALLIAAALALHGRRRRDWAA